MNTPFVTGAASANQLNTLHDVALCRAHALRREAIDDFWRGADAAYEATLSSAHRSAQRLASRLARHASGRFARAAGGAHHHDGA